MFPAGKQDPCVGCTTFTDNIAGLVHVRARDANVVLVSRAPVQELHAYRDRMGWDIPWYSSAGSTFNEDFGATTSGGGEIFRVTVLLREGDDVYKTYWTSWRGTDRLRSDFNLLDLLPYGRQETWEDSPEGWPQGPTGALLRRPDEYEEAAR